MKEYLNELINTYPETQEPILANYRALLEGRDDKNDFYAKCFYTKINNFLALIAKRDASLFETPGKVFIEGIDLYTVWNNTNSTEENRAAIWKYLQLILFTVVGGVKDKATFGETMNLFDGIDENELNEKLKETMSGISEFFSNITNNFDENNETSENGENKNDEKQFEMPNMENIFNNMKNNEEFKNAFDKMGGMPDVENMQEHLKSLFNGKIGSLAKEMAEEISDEFQDILGGEEEMKDSSDVIKKMMKNPKKIMDLMKKISGKLDSKMQNGEISRDEIMKEASELFGKMKDMGGTEQFTELFKNMAKSMGGMGKNMKIDTNALNRMTKQQATKERLLKKLEAKRKAVLENQMRSQPPPVQYSLQQGEQPNNLVFKLDGMENQEKTYIHPDILAEIENESKKEATTEPKKKNKKKKGKK